MGELCDVDDDLFGAAMQSDTGYDRLGEFKEEATDILALDLIEFYEDHHPEKEDAEEHVEYLLANFRHTEIADALQEKYGAVPPCWEQMKTRKDTFYWARRGIKSVKGHSGKGRAGNVRRRERIKVTEEDSENGALARELVAFYEDTDPEREDIEGHVVTLFKDFMIEAIANSLMKKYGKVPPLWAKFTTGNKQKVHHWEAPVRAQAGSVVVMDRHRQRREAEDAAHAKEPRRVERLAGQDAKEQQDWVDQAESKHTDGHIC
jgi:hypothetical protein